MQYYLRHSNVKNNRCYAFYYDSDADKVMSALCPKNSFEKYIARGETRDMLTARLREENHKIDQRAISCILRNARVGDCMADLLSYYHNADAIRAEERKHGIEAKKRHQARNTIIRADGTQIPYITGIGGVQISHSNFIRVEYHLTSQMSQKKLMDTLRCDIKDIIKHAVGVFSARKQFQNAEIPVNFFEVSNCTVTADRRLILTFDVKQRLREMLKSEEASYDYERE